MHRAERRASILLVIAIVAAAAWVTWEQWLRPLPSGTVHFATVPMGAWEQEHRSGERRSGPRPERTPTLFPFDPNGLPLEQWTALGLSERQAAAIHAYERAGGRFRSKADVGRMRVVDPELFAQWRPYIQLPDSVSGGGRSEHLAERDAWKEDRPDRNVRVGPALVELNAADSAALVAVPGIGPAFARGMIRYRDKLGGYRNLDQLAEVYVLRDKPEALARLRERLVLDTLLVRRLPVNTVTVEELAAHPYGGWKVAKALVAYRKQHGPFRTVGDIRGCALVTDSVFRKLAPYLTAP